MIRKTHVAAGVLFLLAGGGAFVAYELREPDAQRIDLRISRPAAGDVAAVVDGSELRLSGTLSGADECSVVWAGSEFAVEAGAFEHTIPAPSLGTHLLWVRATCDGVEVPPLARAVVVAPLPLEGSGDAIDPSRVPVIRLTASTVPLVEPAADFALSEVNREVTRYLSEEIRGAEIIALDVPVGRIAASFQQWAGERLGGAAGERVEEWIPDAISDFAFQMRWAPETSAELSNLELNVGEGVVDATFDLDLTVGIAVEATETGRAARQWDPPPMEISLARLGARFDLSDWPAVSVTQVNLLGDLCERPNGRFWRRRCRDIMPRVVALIERPVGRALNARAGEWTESFSLEEALLRALAPGEEWTTLLQESGAQIELVELSPDRVAFEAAVSAEWLGSQHGIEASAERSGELTLELSAALFNRALAGVFDRPLHEVPGHVLERTAELLPTQTEALERVVADLDGVGRLDGMWTETLALTNLQMEPTVHAVPFFPSGGDGLRIAVHGVRLFRGVDRGDVGLSLSAELPVVIVATDTEFELRPDVEGLLRNLALEPVGPESTTRSDARRFAAFVHTEIRRNFGDDPELPLVDLSGVLDGFELVPVVPREFAAAGIALSLDELRYDPVISTFVATGSGALLDPVDDE